ncbi:MAG: LysM domain-containing protein [Phycisphaeraceae bacterium]
MRNLLGWSVVVVVLGLMGCQNQERAELAEVPPPAYDEAQAYEPVEVAEAEPEAEPEPRRAEADEREQSPRGDGAERRASDGQTRYTVRRKDTLWSIAERHYGDGKRMTDIAEANNISNPDRISEGQEIILP